ncbi:MAG: Ankyrin [Candidatus Scalindua rubra]|uniref:Ankyrin n=1 Tax=Candidatus Scalindua rubra TaxID=1872076 RepID=A0A1E3X508_9BACT|nr:MAG: Ankyrin [Candidatus Scalindua rubra]
MKTINNIVTISTLSIISMVFVQMAVATSQKTDVNKKLIEASWVAYLQLAKLTLNKGADIHAVQESDSKSKPSRPILINREESQDGQMTAADRIHAAAKAGDLLAVTRLLDSDPKLVDAKDEEGWTPLYLASGAGHRNVAEFLIARRASVNANDNIAKGTPLLAAALLGQIDVARLLCDKGADVNAKALKGMTPLIFAAMHGHTEIVKLLLSKGADVDATSNRGATALYLAAFQGSLEAARILIYKGADVNKRDKRGQTPLHCAALNGHRNVVELLLKKGADPNAKSQLGFTPIEVATKSGHSTLADLMREWTAEK